MLTRSFSNMVVRASKVALSMSFVMLALLTSSEIAHSDSRKLSLVAVEVVNLDYESQQNWLPATELIAEPYVRVDFTYGENLVLRARENDWLLDGFVSICAGTQFDPSKRLEGALGVRDALGIIAFARRNCSFDS